MGSTAMHARGDAWEAMHASRHAWAMIIIRIMMIIMILIIMIMIIITVMIVMIIIVGTSKVQPPMGVAVETQVHGATDALKSSDAITNQQGFVCRNEQPRYDQLLATGNR